MKSRKELAAAIMISILGLLSSASGLSFSVASDAGGFTEDIQADRDEKFKELITIMDEGLSDTISGEGSIKKRFFKSNDIGSAEVGFDIKNSESYSYDYYIDQYSVHVSDNLDVTNADKIDAYADARNLQGDRAHASTKVFGGEEKASLRGYSSFASTGSIASEDEFSHNAQAGQSFDSASGAKIQIKEWATNAVGDSASTSTVVNEGSVEWYRGRTGTGWYQHDWPWYNMYEESSFAHTSQDSYDLSGTRIKIDNQATDAVGDTASSSIVVNDGSMSGHYINAEAESYQGHGLEWQNKHIGANTIHDIYGPSGSRIKIDDQAVSAARDTVSASTIVNDGSLSEHLGSAEASWYQSNWYGSLYEGQSASAGQHSRRLSGSKIRMDNRAINARGDRAIASTKVTDGSIDEYSGSATAGWYRSNSEQWQGVIAIQYPNGISGAKLNLRALAVNAEGFKDYKSHNINIPTNVDCENSARVDFSVPSVYQDLYLI